MDHQFEHPDAGKTFLLDLRHPDPTGAIFQMAIAEVLDWQDRVTGQSWATALLHKSHPLHQHYLERIMGDEFQPDPSVVAVIVNGRRWLVHSSEIGKQV